MKNTAHILQSILITPDTLINKYIDSYFIDLKYNLPNEIKTNAISICYHLDLGIDENFYQVVYNLQKNFFTSAKHIKVKIHSYKEGVYIVVPQSFFLDKDTLQYKEVFNN